MARPREFDTDEALADAMNVFWQYGYDAASLAELLKGMGLTRGSLYKAFVDKKSLFLNVLNRYEVEAVDPAVALLTTGPADGLDRIKVLFDSISAAVASGDQRGCLLCSAAAGPAAVDNDIASIVHLQLHRMKVAFEHALSESSVYAQTDTTRRSEIASLLMSQYVSLRVLVRSRASLDIIKECTKALRTILDSPQDASET
jgi:TetR/AcrR family transcriptional repressor of nem operon